jgi:N-methylhydantoinase A/oxoprolinase/acetone carboxylase beta subunit
MQLALGIDTGGTYTDAVLVNHEMGAVLAGAKALTTRHDLSIGIGGAIRAVFAVAELQGTPFAPEDVTLVALSTTLATNALAAGPERIVSIGRCIAHSARTNEPSPRTTINGAAISRLASVS